MGITEKTFYNSNYKERTIEFLSLIDKTCKDFDIHYSLHGGTLLGAERNGKLIPWDEDVDISMGRSDYDKLVNLYNQNQIPFGIKKSDYAPWLTCFYSSDISVDVFIWDYISEYKIQQFIKINLLRFIQGMIKKFNFRHYSSIFQLFPVIFAHLFGLLLSEKFKLKLYNSISVKYFIGHKKYIHRSNDAFIGVRYVFDSQYFQSFKTILLENKKFMVTERYKEFLFRNYGKDYLVPRKDFNPKHSSNIKRFSHNNY